MTGEALTVVDWVAYDSTNSSLEAPLPVLGGWFGVKRRNTWADYEKDLLAEAVPYALAMKEAVVAAGIREGGDWHQDEGVPVFSDRRVLRMSYRAWGDLLAAIWSDADGLPYSYMNFYMSPGATAESIRADMEARPRLYGTPAERAAYEKELLEALRSQRATP